MPEFEVLQFEAPKDNSNYIKVIGVGGGGTNAVNHMFNEGIKGVDFIVCNTDAKSLNASPIQNRIKIGKDGLGAGNKPSVGEAAALAAEDKIKAALINTQMLFITAGMGGGTGTGAAPIIAKYAKEIEFFNDEGEKTDDKILVVAIVTLPLAFEGNKRKLQAEEGIKKLKEIVDSIIIVNTDKIRSKGNIPIPKMFPMADNVLLTASKGIAEIITIENSYIHVDFRDVQEVMTNSGVALMGIGSAYGSGVERAEEAIQIAASSDLLNDCDISGTKNILLYITTSPEEEYAMTYDEQEAIADYIKKQTNCEPDIIWGIGFDESFKDRLDITLIATGFEARDIYNPYDLGNRKVSTLDKEEINAEVKIPELIQFPIISVSPIDDMTKFTKNTDAIDDNQTKELEIQGETSNTVKSPIIHVLDISDISPTKNQPSNNIKQVLVSNEIELEVVDGGESNNRNYFQNPLEPSNTRGIKIIDTISEKPKVVEKPMLNESEINNHEKLVNDRQKRMELFAKLMKEKDGLEKIISTPAYEQYGMDVSDSNHSFSNQEASRLSVEKGDFRLNNSYLHDNPD